MTATSTRSARARNAAGGLALVLAAVCGGGPTAAVTPPEVAAVGPDTSALTAPVAGVPLFTLVDDAAIADAEARARLAAVRALPWAAAVRVARLVPGAETVLTTGRAVAFDVNATRRLVYAGEGRAVNADGSLSWYGVLQGGRFGRTDLVLGGSGLTGTLRVEPPNGATYSVLPLGAGYHAVTYVDPGKVPPPG